MQPNTANTELRELRIMADRHCIATGGSRDARAQWQLDIEQVPPELYQCLRAHFQKEMPAPTPPKLPAPPEQAPAPHLLGPEADKADQAHFWACTQCRTGSKCDEG